MDHSDLLSLVEDIGTGNVLDSEMLEGCSVAAHELDDMDEVMAAKVAAHVFHELYDHNVQTLKGDQADPDAGIWTGNVTNLISASHVTTMVIWLWIFLVHRENYASTFVHLSLFTR